jgi:hypothetical protein
MLSRFIKNLYPLQSATNQNICTLFLHYKFKLEELHA